MRRLRVAGVCLLALLLVPTAEGQQAADMDEANDVRPDAQSGIVDEPDVDLLEARALVDGDDLVLGLRVAGRPAFDSDPTERRVSYVWVVAFEPPAGTRPFQQQDAIVVCGGQEGGTADCVAQRGPFTGDIDAGIIGDTLTVALRFDGPAPAHMAVGAAANLQADGAIVAQDFTPGADSFGPRPTTTASDTPWPIAASLGALAVALRRIS